MAKYLNRLYHYLGSDKMEVQNFQPTWAEERSHLLQQSLRMDNAKYPIDREYPVILDSKNVNYSYCLRSKNQEESNTKSKIIAHLNFLPRIVYQQPEQIPIAKIALVGNVATKQEFRGQGHMRKLINFAIDKAKSEGLDAVVLWSDLVEFYKRLGFTSLGKETRLFFTAKSLTKVSSIHQNIAYYEPKEMSDLELHEVINLRYPTSYCIERQLGEFRSLLSIPDMSLILKKKNQKIVAFAFLGKGVDFPGYIHEWGATSPKNLLEIVSFCLEQTGWQTVGLIAPHKLDPLWQKNFGKYKAHSEQHPLCLAYVINWDKKPMLDQCFFWGLDSI